MADEQGVRPEVIQEEAEEEEQAAKPQTPVDGAADDQTPETTQDATAEPATEEGKDLPATVEAEGTPPAEGGVEPEGVKEDAAGDETAGKDNSNEEGQEGGVTPKPGVQNETQRAEDDVNRPTSEGQDVTKQTIEDQAIDKQTAGEEAANEHVSEGQNVEKHASEGQDGTKSAPDEQAVDQEASDEQLPKDNATQEEQEQHQGPTDQTETTGEDEAALPVEGEEKPEGEEGAGSPKPDADGTPKPEGEGGVEEGAGAEGAPAAEGEGGEEGGAAVEGSAAVEGEGAAGGEGEEATKKDELIEGEHMAEIGEESEPTSPVPQSETFAEGDREESPVAVGERLSREGTPVLQHDGTKFHSPPVPGTPELGEGEEDEEEEYMEQPQYNREQLIEKYHQTLSERQQLQEQNYQLQNKLAEYFRKKKSEDVRQETNVTDQEQRYLKYMANLDELRRQDIEERELYKQQIEELKEKCEEKQERVDEERIKFLEFKRQVGLGAVNSRSGRPIPPKDLEQYLSMENRKEAEVVNVRLENIKLRNKLRKKELALKSKEELAEGLHLIDFEQLKIENQTYNEKIEERNEELLKLRKKITSTVQVLTHLKEKLQFVQAENHVQQGVLHEVEETAAKKRDVLSRTKQARDALRIDNQKLRQNCGLLGNESLLRDFEERKDESEDLYDQLEKLKMLHAELTLNLNGVRKKMEQAHSSHQ